MLDLIPNFAVSNVFTLSVAVVNDGFGRFSKLKLNGIGLKDYHIMALIFS